MKGKEAEFDNGEGSGFVEFEYTPSQQERLAKRDAVIAGWHMMFDFGVIPTTDDIVKIDLDHIQELLKIDEMFNYFNKEKKAMSGEPLVVGVESNGENELTELIKAVKAIVRYNHVDEMDFGTVGDLLTTTKRFYTDLDHLEQVYWKWDEESGIDID